MPVDAGLRFFGERCEKNATGSPTLSSDCLNTQDLPEGIGFMSTAFWLMIAVTSTAFFTFLIFVIWLEGRQKERQAHYRDEMARKIAEADDSSAIMDYVRSTEKADAERVRVKTTLAGLITAAVAAGLMVFLHQIAPGTSVYLVGLIPLLVGIVLLFMGEIMMKSKDN